MAENSRKTAAELFEFLDGLGISHTTKQHEPVFTVAESQSLRDLIPGGHTKNLFVKDKKDQYFVLTVEENAVVDLKSVHKIIGAASRVSFGRPEKMLEYLGVVPGSLLCWIARCLKTNLSIATRSPTIRRRRSHPRISFAFSRRPDIRRLS